VDTRPPEDIPSPHWKGATSEREALEAIEDIRADVSEHNLAGQNQQAPSPESPKRLSAGAVDRTTTPRPFDQIVQSWDTANNPTKLADYSVGARAPWTPRRRRQS
jgi:hypothetical protein